MLTAADRKRVDVASVEPGRRMRSWRWDWDRWEVWRDLTLRPLLRQADRKRSRGRGRRRR